MNSSTKWGMGLVLGLCVLGWWVLSPLCDRIQQTQQDKASLTQRLAELNQAPLPARREGLPKSVVVTTGVQRLLETARERGVKLSLVESPPAPTPREGIHVSGIATLPAMLGWLNALAAGQPTFLLKRVAFRTLTEGGIEFSFYALPVAGLPLVHSQPIPVGNPFCHAYGLAQAFAMGRLPLLQRYPIHDEQFLGVAMLGQVRRALVQVPGGRLQAVGVGEWVGQERAEVITITDHALRLRWPDGRNDVMKREGVDDA